jgi:diguanylate cyclase (GGDEF)-like protein
MAKQEKFRLSLRQVLTIPYVVLLSAVALTIVALSYWAGVRAVDTVSSQLLLEKVSRIGQAVDRHMVGSGAALEAAFPQGMTVPPTIDAELDTLRNRFWIATSLHLDPNDYVYYGNRRGQVFGLYRRSLTEGELRMKLVADETRAFYTFTGINGTPVLASRETRLYDPRERPWYGAAAAVSTPIWTPVYIDFSTSDLVATRARRVPGPGGEFEGVVATDVKLRALNDFVSRQRVSENGLAFIVEPSGDLIASSAGPNVKVLADGKKVRVSAADSGNARVNAIYGEVRARLAAPGATPDPQEFSFDLAGGTSMHAAFARIKDDAGLDWITVVAMPSSDYMTGVTENLTRTAILSALAALLAIAIGLGILSWVARDLKHLSEAALHVGEGQLDWPVRIKRPDEIGQLAKSFETMQRRLQTDGLTGLANREAFMLRLRFRVATAREAPAGALDGRFAVLFIDLNRFKLINDQFGHGVGDQVLIEIAQRLKAAVRLHDLVARLSGDEFVILLDRVEGRDSLERVRRQIQTALQAPLQALGDGLLADTDFGGSVGEALFPDDGTDAESLLGKADRRMYKRKFADTPPSGFGPLRRVSDSTAGDESNF